MREIMRAKIDAIRTRLRNWLGIVYLDQHLSGRIRELESWKDNCIVAVPVDKNFKGKDIIILAGRFGAVDRVQIIPVEFESLADFIDLARRLQNSFHPKARFFWDGPSRDFTRLMRDELGSEKG